MPHPHRSAPLLLRAVLALPFVVLAGFSSFGFLAAFELAEWHRRLPWQAGYASLILGSAGAAIALLRPRKSPPRGR